MPTGSITDQDKGFVETWENVATFQNAIIRLDVRGEERQEVIAGENQRFMLTSEERLITEAKVRDVKHNPFTNGSFRPVIVPDSVTVESNPNALSETEILKIMKSSAVAWEAWLAEIDSIATLRRMLDLADQDEDLPLRRYRDIEARIVSVRGTSRIQLDVKDDQLRRFLSDKPGSGSGPTMEQERAARRGQGGRSTDYR